MLKDIFTKCIESVIPSDLPTDLEEFVKDTCMEKIRMITTKGMGQYSSLEYYGKRNGIANARLRIPVMGTRSERSYHFSIASQDSIIITDEGIFPSDL